MFYVKVLKGSLMALVGGRWRAGPWSIVSLACLYFVPRAPCVNPEMRLNYLVVALGDCTAQRRFIEDLLNLCSEGESFF